MALMGRLDAVEFFVGVAGKVHDAAVHVGGPAGVAVAVGYLGTGEGEEGLDLACDIPFARLNRRALARGHEHLVVALHLDRCEVGRCLYEAFEVAAHRHYTVRGAVERLYESLGSLMVKGELGAVVAFELEFEGWFETGIFVFDIGHELVECHTHLLFARSVDAEYGVGGAWYGVAQVAAVDFAQCDFVVEAKGVEEAGKQLVGIGAAQVYVAARVAAETAPRCQI